MGSLAPTGGYEKDREINVLVTGFGPFGENAINPSYLIAQSLPTKHDIRGLPPIILHSHTEPITVSYAYVRKTIPELLYPKDGLKPKYDIVLNIGLAPGRNFYTLETLAHRDGYIKKDVDGKTLEGDTLWQRTYNAPERLHTSFNTEDAWRRWKSGLVNVDLRPSYNAGHYLCDFTYYACMLEYWRREPGRQPCMFLHVPSGLEEEDIERGREVTLGLITAIVASEVAGDGRKGNEEFRTETDWDRAADDECS